MKRFCAGLALIFMLVASVSPVTLAAPKSSAKAPPKTAAQGQDKSEVVRAQQRLIELGFLSGTADGAYGKQTAAAVKAFQTYVAGLGHDIKADGQLGARTKKLLFDVQIAERLLAVRKGDKGAPVQKLQKRLLALGFLTSAPDGAFGEGTERALTAFQSMLESQGVSGVQINGVADQLTREYLFDRDLKGFDIHTPVFFKDSDPLALDGDYLYAGAALLMDADTGEVLLEKNAREKMYPASTTKLMTLLLGLKRGNFKQVVTIPKAAANIPGDSSRVPVVPGEKMPYVDLLFGLMMRSGNDAAMAIAELVSGSVDAFVEAMNQEAAQLGMTGTHFTNPHGYHDPEHYSTAYDMALLMRAALQDSRAKSVIERRQYTMTATTQRKNAPLQLSNHYDLLDPNSKYYSPDALGGKTGYTGMAGQCFVGAARKDGTTLIAVVLDSGYYKTDRWLDVARLFAYGFAREAAA